MKITLNRLKPEVVKIVHISIFKFFFFNMTHEKWLYVKVIILK